MVTGPQVWAILGSKQVQAPLLLPVDTEEMRLIPPYSVGWIADCHSGIIQLETIETNRIGLKLGSDCLGRLRL